MAKIYLSPSNQRSNIGQGNYGSEKQRMIQVAEVVYRELVRKFEVKMANYDWNLQPRCTESNNWGSDIYVAIHSNAGGGRGCEVFAYSKESDGYRLAQKVYNRIQAITPSSDRGIKFNELYETKVPYCPAILIEVAFHDNWDDANWIINNIELIGTEIAKGIYEYFGVSFEEPKPVVEPEPILEPVVEEPKEEEPTEPVITPIPQEPAETKVKKWYIVLIDAIIDLLKKILKKTR